MLLNENTVLPRNQMETNAFHVMQPQDHSWPSSVMCYVLYRLWKSLYFCVFQKIKLNKCQISVSTHNIFLEYSLVHKQHILFLTFKILIRNSLILYINQSSLYLSSSHGPHPLPSHPFSGLRKGEAFHWGSSKCVTSFSAGCNTPPCV